MLWAALLTAFYGFLRVSEYTSLRKKTFDPTSTLLFSDMNWASDGSVTLLIKTSKTDPFREGIPLRLAPNGSALCPVNALKHLQRCHPTKNGPLFTFQNGRFLTRRDINNLLLSTTDGVANVSSHSLRIGAASTAAAAGCPKWLIQALGRWSSDCFREYIQIPRATIRKTSMILANSHTIDREIRPRHITHRESRKCPTKVIMAQYVVQRHGLAVNKPVMASTVCYSVPGVVQRQGEPTGIGD